MSDPADAVLAAADLERIARVIELSEGFLLQPIVVQNHDVAGAIVDGLKARGIGVDALSLDTDAHWQRLLGALHSAPTGQATLVYAESLASSSASVLRILNQKRDSVAADHAKPLLWATTPALARVLWDHAPDLWSVAAVPIRIETTTPARWRNPGFALAQLLGELFNASELRRFVDHFAPELASGLAFARPVAASSRDLVQGLQKHGLVDARFFEALGHERPLQRARIREVAALWGLSLAPLAETTAGAAPSSLASVIRGPAGALTIIAAEVAAGIDGSTFLEQVRDAAAQDRGSLLTLGARASDEALARTPADWSERLREAVGPSLRHWLGASRWLVVAVVDPGTPERLCDPADFAAPEVFTDFFVDLLERDLGPDLVQRLSITLLLRFPGRVRRALARRLRSRMKVELALLRADAAT